MVMAARLELQEVEGISGLGNEGDGGNEREVDGFTRTRICLRTHYVASWLMGCMRPLVELSFVLI